MPTLVVLVCLTLTKSRSAYVGLAAAVLVLGWRERRRVRPRTLGLAAVGAILVVAALATAGLKSGRLDRLYAVTSGINEAIIRIPEEFRLFEEACRIAVEKGGLMMAWVGLEASGLSTAAAPVELLDRLGRVVRTLVVREGFTRLDIAGLAPGLYVVRLAGQVQRLVVE